MSGLVVKTACLFPILTTFGSIPDNSYVVLVTRYYPFWVKGLKDLIDEYIPCLGPSPDLLKEFRTELGRLHNLQKAWNITHYENRYRRQITHDSKALGKVRELKEKAKDQDVYLLCYCKDERFCHRRILKELIEELY